MNARCFGASPLVWLVASLLSLSDCSCDDKKPAANGGRDDGGGFNPLVCRADNVMCDGALAKTCDGKGGFKGTTDCSKLSQQCMDSQYNAAGDLIPLGCVACKPGDASCQGGSAKYCREDGSGYDVFDCDPMQGMVCEADGCKGVCAPPEVTTSYIGCDYYPTVTLNPVWSGFSYAIAVSNASDEPAHVIVTKADATVRELTIAVNGLEIIKLDWVSSLKGGDQNACQIPPEPGDSRLVKQGAYRLRSDRPVTVYQFSPLEYQLGKDGSIPAGCPVGTMCMGVVADCLSFSNDASLLLPATALTGDYTVLSWPSNGNTASFYAVTATQDDTKVTLKGHASFRPGGGVDKDGNGEIALNRGDVLQVVASHGTETADATGSVVHADKPVQVIGGHSCANIPDPDTAACDHLEQALFPSQILGKDYVVTYPSAVASESPYIVRIEAVQAGTKIEFDPPQHAPLTLGPDDPPFELAIGSFMRSSTPGERGTEVKPVDVHITADKPIAIAQYMQGQMSVPSGSGDPSMSLAVPTAQYRGDYIFTASTTYDSNFINVIAPIGTDVSLDGKPLSGVASDVGSSNFQVIRMQLPAAGSGVYRLHAGAPVGLAVYGYGRYTSYMFPGGLDLKRITIIQPD